MVPLPHQPPEQKPGGLYGEGRWDFTSPCLVQNRISNQSRSVHSAPYPRAIGSVGAEHFQCPPPSIWYIWLHIYGRRKKKLGLPFPGSWVVVWCDKTAHQLAHLWCPHFPLDEIHLGKAKKLFHRFQNFHFTLLILLGWQKSLCCCFFLFFSSFCQINMVHRGHPSAYYLWLYAQGWGKIWRTSSEKDHLHWHTLMEIVHTCDWRQAFCFVIFCLTLLSALY